MKDEVQAGFAIWITGLPASGKSRVTAALVSHLATVGERVTVLESDAMRKLFSGQALYDDLARDRFYGSLAFIGRVLTEHGINVIFDATANRRVYRDRARRQIPRSIEILVDTPVDVCIERDPKGIYRKGRAGIAQNVPGLQAKYEPPISPDLVIRGDHDTPEDAADRIVQILRAKGMLRQ